MHCRQTVKLLVLFSTQADQSFYCSQTVYERVTFLKPSSFYGKWIHCQGRQVGQNWYCLTSEKGVYSKRKAFAPRGSKCFPLRVDPFFIWEQMLSFKSRPLFQKGFICMKANGKPWKSSPLWKKRRKNYRLYSPLRSGKLHGWFKSLSY